MSRGRPDRCNLHAHHENHNYSNQMAAVGRYELERGERDRIGIVNCLRRNQSGAATLGRRSVPNGLPSACTSQQRTINARQSPRYHAQHLLLFRRSITADHRLQSIIDYSRSSITVDHRLRSIMTWLSHGEVQPVHRSRR